MQQATARACFVFFDALKIRNHVPSGQTMFTGLVDHTGRIETIEVMPKGVLLCITTQFTRLKTGESIAVDGICLTVAHHEKKRFRVQLSRETLEKTTAKYYRAGQIVNLERALSMGERLGGHFVSGHIDQTGVIEQIVQHDAFCEYHIGGFTPENQPLLIEKGSIAINGISLTLNRITASTCEIMLIPHTLLTTNLSTLKVKNTVNIEFDLLTKIVAKQTRGILHEKSI